MAGVFERLLGVMGSFFQIGGTGGPALKNNAGAVEIRKSDDSGFTTLRAALPAEYNANDLVPMGAIGDFGTGSLGAAVFDGTTTIAGVVPIGNNYPMFGQDFTFTTVTVNAGVTLTFAYGHFLLATQSILNNGIITAAGGNGGNGAAASGGAGGTVASPVTLGNGGAGGAGQLTAGTAGTSVTHAHGGGGGAGGTSGAHAGGAAGTSTLPTFAFINKGRLYSVLASTELPNGGAGGGGGGGDGSNGGGGGGGGGGALALAAPLITNNGTISVQGGNGGNATAGNAAGGGAGGGGVCFTVQIAYVGTAPNVASGSVGSGSGTGGSGAAGSAGLWQAFQGG